MNTNPYFSYDKDEIREDNSNKKELPLLSSFCFCYTLDVGINFIALTDLLMAMIWFTLFFVGIGNGMWPFYLLYLLVSVFRLNYFVQYI